MALLAIYNLYYHAFRLSASAIWVKNTPGGWPGVFLFLYIPSRSQVGDYVLVHLLVYLILRAVDEIARDDHDERDD